MGMFAGIIGGALEGGGKAAVAGLHTAQEQYGKEALLASEHEFQTSLEGTRQAGADRRLGVEEGGRNTRQTEQITSTEGISNADRTARTNTSNADRTSRENVSAASDKAAGERSAATDKAAGERNTATLASNERIHTASNANGLAVARLGGTVQTDKDGYMFMLDKEGKLSPLMLPGTKSADGFGEQPKQMKTHKDLTPAAKLRAETLKAQLIDLDRAEIAALGDKEQIKAIEGRRADLTRRQLNVLQGVSEDPQRTGADGPKPNAGQFDKSGGPASAPEKKTVTQAPAGIVRHALNDGEGPSSTEDNLARQRQRERDAKIKSVSAELEHSKTIGGWNTPIGRQLTKDLEERLESLKSGKG